MKKFTALLDNKSKELKLPKGQEDTPWATIAYVLILMLWFVLQQLPDTDRGSSTKVALAHVFQRFNYQYLELDEEHRRFGSLLARYNATWDTLDNWKPVFTWDAFSALFKGKR